MPSEKYRVGIVFRPLEASGSGSSKRVRGAPTTKGHIGDAAITHWILVFSSGSSSRRVELINNEGRISYSVRDSEHKVPAYYFANFTGHLSDINKLAREHPMNGKHYNEVVNNCQHWAAHFLASLSDLAKASSHRHFGITDRETFKLVVHVAKNKGHGANLPNDLVVATMNALVKLIAN
ncbi:hypothetical protein FRC17_010283 [Serendipita sp. 399]|nr:hypothetical protein FRC17_010283 [Serendipita sp. 399]